MASDEPPFQDVTFAHVNSGHKRRCVTINGGQSDQPILTRAGKDFVTVPKEAQLFHSEQWTNRDTTIFTPITDDTAIRIRSFDQITYPCRDTNEVFFIGDSVDRYSSSISGKVIHLWRYSERLNRLFVARSLLCTDNDVYEELCRVLTGF